MDRLEWGSATERNELLTASLDCLTSCLQNGGSFFPSSVRSLLESVSAMCLCHVRPEATVRQAWNGNVLCALLTLACTCLGTPWQDGSSSSLSLSIPLQRTAKALLKSTDHAVRREAQRALQTCDLQSTPRIPPLLVITRSSATEAESRNGNGGGTASAQALAEQLIQSEKVEEDERRRKRARVEAEEAAAATKEGPAGSSRPQDSGRKATPEGRKQGMDEDPINSIASVQTLMKTNGERTAQPSLSGYVEADETHDSSESKLVSTAMTESLASRVKHRDEAKSAGAARPDADLVHTTPEVVSPTTTSRLVDGKKDVNQKEEDGNKEGDEDDEMPMIVDCGPDEEDDD